MLKSHMLKQWDALGNLPYELLAEEMDHLGKVLWYNNYPKWMIDQHGRSDSPKNANH